MRNLIWMLLLALTFPCFAQEPEPTFVMPYYSIEKTYDFNILPYEMEQGNYSRLSKYLSADKFQALQSYMEGKIHYAELEDPDFFTIYIDPDNEPIDEGQRHIIDILQSDNQDLPFSPTLWEFYGAEAGVKSRMVYFRSKQIDPFKPVGLCVGYLSDGRPEELIEAVEGDYDWLILWLGRNIEEMECYPLENMLQAWKGKCKGRPVILAGIFAKSESVAIRQLSARVKLAGYSGLIAYVRQ